MQGDLISGVLLPLILAFIMFSLGLGLTVDDFRRIFTQPRALLVGVVCHFVLLPLGSTTIEGVDTDLCSVGSCAMPCSRPCVPARRRPRGCRQRC